MCAIGEVFQKFRKTTSKRRPVKYLKIKAPSTDAKIDCQMTKKTKAEFYRFLHYIPIAKFIR